ncbi:uncharacterized protein LOC135476805 [Liolophura sinensis]|uniref:uncharacterized protein LOC135476805 n=1 Tax=Liolophura sinensis TaxID=3198878 RepID=UPI00315805FA
MATSTEQAATTTATHRGLDVKTESERYNDQRRMWPSSGRHILAHYDDSSIIVYQAFKSSIADYAVKHQRFGGPDYKFERMTWIKTNFLWMMYRSGWATKPGQNRILAIRISRDGFEKILANAFTIELQKSKGLTSEDVNVRLQWDPDHSPNYHKQQRRAIQLGLKGEIVKKFSNDWILGIEDITDFVREQHQVLKMEGEGKLQIPRERVYPVRNPGIAARIALDIWDTDGPSFVS